MEWQPQFQGLNELLHLLRDAINPNNRDQLLVQKRLASFNTIPDYNAYLAYILLVLVDQDSYIRSIAGLTLKNNLLNHFEKTPAHILNYVKNICLKALDLPDSDLTIRRTIDTVISTILVKGKVMNWLSAVKHLIQHLESTNPLTVEMSLDTIKKICEDGPNELSNAIDNDTPILDDMIPKLISFINHSSNHDFQILAIQSITYLVHTKPPSLLTCLHDYIQALLTSNTSSDDNMIRQEVCRSFVMLLDHYAQNMLPYLDPIIDYILTCNCSENKRVALEACDFWYHFNQLESHLRAYLIPHLPNIIPVIVSSLVYTDEDLYMFGENENNDSNPQELPPRLSHRNKYLSIAKVQEDDEDYDEDDEEFYSEWTLRLFSATCLEALTTTFKSKVTQLLLPILNHAFTSDDWRIVESGILALSAAAEDGVEELTPYLPNLIPFLITNLSNPNVHVRYMTCWTVSRFSAWIVTQCNTLEGRTAFYEPVLRALLKRILDKSKKVQEAACSAFSTLEEQASEQELVPYLSIILNHLTRALRLYRNRNLRLLYDTIGTLAESVGSSLNEPGFIAVLMPALISRWHGHENTDSELFPLLVCLTDIATSIGMGFLPFTKPVISRCIMLVSTKLQSTMQNDHYDEFGDEFIVVPLDLLSGIVQGLGNKVEPFVNQSALLPLLDVCAHYDTHYQVLKPTYALIGDLAKACFTTLTPYLGNIMPELIRQMENDDMSYKSVRNNAIWAVGEIAIRWTPQEMEKYVEPILRCLVPLIHYSHQSPYIIELQENAANTIGRLGVNNPQIVAYFLPQFAGLWLFKAKSMSENEEKDSAFQGFCNALQYCPNALNEKMIRALFDTISHWQNPSVTLKKLFDQIVTGYRGYLNKDQWQQVSSNLEGTSMVL